MEKGYSEQTRALKQEAPSVDVPAGVHLREAEAGSRDSYQRGSSAVVDIHALN
jgi:hypothetical protein